MNKTQKGAWFTLGVAILLLVFLAIIFSGMFAPVGKMVGTGLVKVWCWFILVFLAGGVAFVHWKRQPSNVDFDERDNSVRKNAILAAFVSLWVLLFAAGIIPSFVAGDTGSIQVCLLPIINIGVFLIVMLIYADIDNWQQANLLPIINIGVFLIVMLIYSVAVLVQYCWGGKGEKS